MTPRPKKKPEPHTDIWLDWNETEFIHNGYNQCYDEFEKFLPTLKELKDIVRSEQTKWVDKPRTKENIAQALHKRLRGNSDNS